MKSPLKGIIDRVKMLDKIVPAIVNKAKTVEKIKAMNEWYESDVDHLITYVYWLKNQIPKDREQAKKDLVKQLNEMFPCPEEYMEKWGLA